MTDYTQQLAGFLAGLLSRIEDTGGFGRQIELPAATFHFWRLTKFSLDQTKRHLRIAARFRNQAGRETFLIVEENLQDVIRGKLLVAFS